MEAHAAGDVAETITSFRLISVRSVLAFFTLFFWAGAFYLTAKLPAATAMLYAVLWGLGAGLLVAWLVHLLRRMAESGTAIRAVFSNPRVRISGAPPSRLTESGRSAWAGKRTRST